MKNADAIRFGLNKKQLQLIMNVIESFPEVEKVFIFGSRAIKANRNGSDLVLAVRGRQITPVLLNRYSSALDDLPCLLWLT